MRPLHLVVLALIFAAPPASADSGWRVNADAGSGTVEFHAIGHPSALKIHGKGGAPHGALTVTGGKATGTLTFDLDSLDTGINRRNEHMKKKYLETGKFPQASFTLSSLPVPEAIRSGDGEAESPFEGSLTIHGVKKPIQGKAKLKRSGDKLNVEAKFDTKVGDFNIDSPSFAGITMADDVKVDVELTAPIEPVR